MAKKPTPLAGEATTTNYGWVKPTVGSSVDLWGGYINADLDSIDGVVHAIDTRSAYVLPVASTTILGGVKVDGTTIQAAPDGTISTTVVPMGDNRIINGDMRIDQRNNGAGGTALGYTIDRWQYLATQTSKGTWQQVNFGASGFPYALRWLASSSFTPAAGDTFYLNQTIEADMISDFQWGTANAQPVTLSFIAMSSLTGTFGGSIRNLANTRSYPFTFSLPVASTPAKISITIPGDTAGAWVMSGNAGSLQLSFDLGAGATYRGPAGAWAGTQYNGATGSVSVVGTNGANFYVTGVKLEIGSVATPFNRQSLAKSMADCQRYYQAGNFGLSGNATATTTTVGYEQTLAVAMRATPTIVITAENATTGMSTRQIAPDSPYHIRPNGVAQNAFNWLGTFTASAEL